MFQLIFKKHIICYRQLALLESMRGLTGEAKEVIVKKLRATLVQKKLRGVFEAVVWTNLLLPKVRQVKRKKQLVAIFAWVGKAVAKFKATLKRRRDRIRKEQLKRNLAVFAHSTRFVILLKRLLAQRKERVRHEKLQRNLAVLTLSTRFVVAVQRFVKARRLKIARETALKKNLAIFYYATRASILVRRFLKRKQARLRRQRRDHLLKTLVISTRFICAVKRVVTKRRARILLEEANQKRQRRDRLLKTWVLATKVVCAVKRVVAKRRARILAEEEEKKRIAMIEEAARQREADEFARLAAEAMKSTFIFY